MPGRLARPRQLDKLIERSDDDDDDRDRGRGSDWRQDDDRRDREYTPGYRPRRKKKSFLSEMFEFGD